MVSGFSSLRDFAREADSRPSNLVLFPDETLLHAALDRSGEMSAAERAKALAELAVRFFLRPDPASPLRPALVSGLGEWPFRVFLDWCERSLVRKTGPEAPAAPAFGPAFGPNAGILRQAFQQILCADGIIPVFDHDGDAYLLPFRFGRKTPPGASLRALDAEDAAIPIWTDELRHLPDRVDCDVRVGIVVPPDSPLELDGGSLLLPVLAAWWRRNGDLPRYDPLRVLFTGSFREGLLRGVETAAKRKKVKKTVRDGILVHPVPGKEALESDTILAGSGADAVLEALREIVEKTVDFDPDYAVKRLAAFEPDVRQTRTTDWDGVLQRLERLRAGLDPDLDGEELLRAVLLTAAANCHAGHTAAAAEWNSRAQSSAACNPEFEPLLLRARIEQLVILQDSEDFDGIFGLVPDLEKEIEAFARNAGEDGRSADLQMRFHGSMGQFLVYAHLAGFSPGSNTPEAARLHFEKALGLADGLYRAGRDILRAADAAQDANYLLLWSAFFGRSELDSRLEAALRLAARSGASRAKNERFAFRNHALGLYRAVLADEVPSMPDLAGYGPALERQWPEDWIAGTTAKYLGAVAAAAGAEAEAARLFGIATAAIDPDAKEIVGVIRMTVYAEAFRSLRHFPVFAARAEECRREALRFLRSGDPAAETKSAWRDWLETPDAAPFPGLSYWY